MRRVPLPFQAWSSALVLVVAWLTLVPTASAQGTSPAASSGPGPAPTASPWTGPLPDLTMAPLVTLPPLIGLDVPDRDLPTDGYALGSPDAPVTIEVFEDYQCPYCRLFTLEVEPLLVERWVRPGLARLVFRDLPFLGEESRWAAVAARIAAEQDRFWPFHDRLFANQLGENVGSYTPDRLLRLGQAAGLDMELLIAGLQVPAARQTWAIIEQEAREAAQALGVTGTPTVVVNGRVLESPAYETVEAAVIAALAPATASPSPAPPTATP